MANLVPVRNFNIEAEKMNLVLKKRRVKFSWEDLINDYLTYDTKFNPNVINDLDAKDLSMIRHVFRFRTHDVPKMKKEFNNWLKAFPQFFAHKPEEIILKMVQARTEKYPYINDNPEYGGFVNDEVLFDWLNQRQ